ncbi:adenosylcobalamin-dependent ribonucleoside-diphosphate reductase [Candidatus Microgenomates bacterium]|nr:adenosylcobalamin-dependent ribonucleoside-diphosphate reductase [Candidatus Microgenomates bacterium]
MENPPDTKLITHVIFQAAQAVGGKNEDLAGEIAEKVLVYLATKFPKKKNFTQQELDDAVEKILIEEGHAKTARFFILDRQEKESEEKVKELLGVKDDVGFPVNSLLVLKNKYLQKNGKGEVRETPRQMFWRVASAIAGAEEEDKQKFWADKFFEIMTSLEFLPGGRTLANAGSPSGQLASCFVLPMEDNIEEMFESIKASALLKKNGGGVGFSFSKIRPKGDFTRTASGACGPVALMKVLDSASDILLQDGGRRSGNMVVLSVSHPDVLEFISCKEQDNFLPHINYSLAIDSRFMKAVEKGEDWNLVSPRNGQIYQTLSARSIFELAATHAWKSGDPGVIFLDRINRDNPTPHLGQIDAVNLCGEQPLLSYEACNLGSINLVKFIKRNSSSFSRSVPVQGRTLLTDIDWKRLEEVIRIAVRFMDNAIDVCRYPLAQVDRVVKGNRKIGLGVMGWADLLVKMGVRYDSDEALKLAERVIKFITKVSHEESQKLGREKGSFTHFEGSRWHKKKIRSMRNATTTTIAPTGSLAMLAGVSSGIEPLFALSYYKEVFGGTRLPEVNQDLMKVLEGLKLKNLEEVREKIVKSGSVCDIKEIPLNVRQTFVIAHEISPEWHIKMQAAFQKHTDNAVSKTINLANKATIEDVQNVFVLAWKLGCKGITIYRDKSRQTQVLNVGNGEVARVEEQTRNTLHACPQCGHELVRGEGCLSCPSCGFSACEA